MEICLAHRIQPIFSLAFDHILDILALLWWDVDISLPFRFSGSSFTSPRIFSLHFSSGLQQSGRCLLVYSAKVMSSYKWQHHDPSLSSSSYVNEMSPATHNTPTARENHLFLIVFSEQGALKAAMALGERNIVPNSQQSPFSCTKLLFSVSFQELEICSRMHIMVSTGEWQPLPQEKFLYQIHHLQSKRKALLISEVYWCQQVSRKKQVKRKVLYFLPRKMLPTGVCKASPTGTVLGADPSSYGNPMQAAWHGHCSEWILGWALVLMVLVPWVMTHLKHYSYYSSICSYLFAGCPKMSQESCGSLYDEFQPTEKYAWFCYLLWPPRAGTVLSIYTTCWKRLSLSFSSFFYLVFFSCIIPGDLWCFMQFNYIWEEK